MLNPVRRVVPSNSCSHGRNARKSVTLHLHPSRLRLHALEPLISQTNTL